MAGAADRAGSGLGGGLRASPGTHTTLVVAATNARISKAQARQLAASAQAGLTRAVRPVTPFDGDTCFTLGTATGPEVPLIALSVAVQEVVARAVVAAVAPAR